MMNDLLRSMVPDSQLYEILMGVIWASSTGSWHRIWKADGCCKPRKGSANKVVSRLDVMDTEWIPSGIRMIAVRMSRTALG
ncbi:hypothetical protein C9J01_29035 [Photobacterium rosenbergii]|uniref:Uncharacterized protein n=1 Tax=Photobacterium rosenbergii TaxID=294936 RepID=A0A2T3MU20_9GAMM|nr:hypothetical protein C9J01_29035 [Photobacterium rosenbergii]